jgi:MFS family permease
VITAALKRRVLILLWIAFFVAYLDRANINIAAPSIIKDFGLTKFQFGEIASAFTAGYAILQIPGGLLADRFGAKRMLMIALAVWSMFTGITGLAVSLISLIVIRVLFGIGEGLENGAHFKALGDTFAPRERSGASAPAQARCFTPRLHSVPLPHSPLRARSSRRAAGARSFSGSRSLASSSSS